jgi:hypothetical protein
LLRLKRRRRHSPRPSASRCRHAPLLSRTRTSVRSASACRRLPCRKDPHRPTRPPGQRCSRPTDPRRSRRRRTAARQQRSLPTARLPHATSARQTSRPWLQSRRPVCSRQSRQSRPARRLRHQMQFRLLPLLQRRPSYLSQAPRAALRSASTRSRRAPRRRPARPRRWVSRSASPRRPACAARLAARAHQATAVQLAAASRHGVREPSADSRSCRVSTRCASSARTTAMLERVTAARATGRDGARRMAGALETTARRTRETRRRLIRRRQRRRRSQTRRRTALVARRRSARPERRLLAQLRQRRGLCRR